MWSDNINNHDIEERRKCWKEEEQEEEVVVGGEMSWIEMGETEARGGFKRNHRKARVITLLTFIGLSPISCAEVLFYLFIFLILF